jgi:hypothetical protein
VAQLRHEIRETAESVYVVDEESANHLRDLLDAKTAELRAVIDSELEPGERASGMVVKRVDFEAGYLIRGD